MISLNLILRKGHLLVTAFFFLAVSGKAQQWYDNGSNIYSRDGAQVGIGTHSPNSALTVRSSGASDIVDIATNNLSNCWLQVGNLTAHVNLGVGQATAYPYIWSSNGVFFIGDDGAPTIYVNGMHNGSVGIGTLDTKGYMFAVNGNAVFNKVVVKAYPWSDYVFDPGYRLKPLKEVEQYIHENKHLPDVPSAAEVEKDGVDVGGNQAVLLKKIEELTLYVIEQQKEIERLKSLVEGHGK